MKISVGEAIRRIDDVAWSLIERAMQDDAAVSDIGAAAAAVRLAAAMRRKLGVSTSKHEDIYAEFLTGLSLRLMKIDGGEDLTEEEAAAAIISGKLLDR